VAEEYEYRAVWRRAFSATHRRPEAPEESARDYLRMVVASPGMTPLAYALVERRSVGGEGEWEVWAKLGGD